MTDTRKIQFLWFDGCPLAPAARQVLHDALDHLNGLIGYSLEEVDLNAADTPGPLKRWGSPTILLDGRDITGAEPGTASHCKVYSGPGGVPAVMDIVAALESSGQGRG